MPRGPRGEKRPADVIGNAVKVMRIATGEETEELLNSAKSKVLDARMPLQRRRSEIARKASAKREQKNQA